MRLTFIGHACLFAETRAGSILVDPWLFGSAFSRSWWHYPPSPTARPEWLAADHVYLTHHHFDHFHYPSMRRIDRSATVLVPEFGVDMMAGEVRALGFTTVREMPHGKIVSLGDGVRVASYQYGADDSLFVIADGDDVVVDANDCKIRGRALRRVLDDFGRPTFLLKSHSWAQAYPHSYTAADPDDLTRLRRESYWHDFIHVARELQPRYAVPFGSMVAFFHPDSVGMNEHVVTPPELAEHVAGAEGLDHTELVVMAPGDSWDSEGGFDRSDRDWYTDRAANLERMRAEVAGKLAEQEAYEQSRSLAFETFERYFGAFAASLPRRLWRRAIPRPIAFSVPSSDEPYWVVDFAGRRVWRQVTPPEPRASVVHIAEGLLDDCIEKRIVHLLHAAIRVRVDLEPGGFDEDTAFWLLLMLWELGYLPIRRSLAGRVARVAWRRRLEALGYVDALRESRSEGGSFQERMVRSFASHGED
jgi:hypothetical protein